LDPTNATAYSYQAVHKVLQMLVDDGLARKTGKTFAVTRKGQLKILAWFFLTVRRADMRMLRILFEMLVFHNPPSK
jgi:predicted transcriptional regulator